MSSSGPDAMPHFSALLRAAAPLLDAMNDAPIPARAAPFVARYEEVGHRNAFLWRWAQVNIDATTLSAVPHAERETTRVTKLLCVILNVLLDDVADARGDAERLEAAIATATLGVSRPIAEADRDYFDLMADLRRAIDADCRALPAYARVAALLDFDWSQICNCMRYARLVNEMPALLNEAEHAAYAPHNMNMMVFATIDLASSPHIEARDYGAIREIAWHMQSMGQLGNMIATWPREIRSRDFTSAIFALGLARAAFSVDDLRVLEPDAIAERVRASGLEAELLERWGEHRRAAIRAAGRTQAIDVTTLLAGLDALLGTTVGGRARL
jgi:hypothetical protein